MRSGERGQGEELPSDRNSSATEMCSQFSAVLVKWPLLFGLRKVN